MGDTARQHMNNDGKALVINGLLLICIAIAGVSAHFAITLGERYADALDDPPPLNKVTDSPQYQACLADIGDQVNLNYARLTVKTFCYREAIQQQPRPRDLEQLHIYYTGKDKQAFGDRLLHGKPANHPE